MPEQASIRSAPSTFVGRSRQLAELCTGLDETRNGQGRLFLLTGEPGIGKSRLADEVAAQAASRAMAVLRAQCWEDGGTPAYWPFVQLIRAALAGPDHDALLKSWSAANVAQDFAQFIPELKPKEPLLAQGSIQGSVDARDARFRLFDSVSAMLKSFASLRALLLIVEDLHAADQALLQMLRFVVNQLRGSAVMVLVTYRGFEMQRSPALSPHIGGLIRQGTEIPLVALSQDDAARMIEDRAGSPSSPRMVSDIYQATAGNPLFIDGLVRVLSAEGRLGGTSRLNLAAFRVPDGVREAIRRWLDLLSNRPVLVIAAAIGQQFELKCLQRVTQAAHHELLDALRDASDMGVVTALSRGAYCFTHALIRKALYDELSSAQRAGVHQKIGQAIDELYQIDVEVHAAALAHHFREAGETNKAIDYSIRAGESARAVFAYEEAIAQWRTALEMMPEGPVDAERRAKLLERTAELLGMTDADGGEQSRYYRQALNLYRDLGRTEAAVRVQARMAGFVTLRGAASDISRILSHQPATDSLTGENREAGVSLIWRHIAEATAASQSARIGQALAASRRAMEISRQIEDQVLWARAGITHALSLFASGQVVQSTALIRRVADAADRLNDGITGAGILTVSCHVSSWLFDPNAAEIWLKHELDKPRMADASHLRIILFDWLQLVAAIAGKLPDPDRIVAHVQTNPPSDTLVLFYHGEWERAEPELSRAVDQAREEGRHISTCTSGHWLARLWRAVALRGKAEAKLHENLAIAIEAPHLALELNTRAELASILAETGRPDQARPHLARCREVIAAGEDWRGLVGHIERAEAVVAAAEARFDDANRHFEQAAAIYRRYQVPFEQAEALHYWGRALTAAGGRGAALEKLDGATELYRRHGAGQRWLEGVRVDRLRAQSIGTVVARESRAALSANLQAGLADRSNGDRRQASPMAAGFRRQGEYWTLSRADLESQLKDRKGLRYIACLLRYPGQEFAALEMAAAIEHGNGSPLASVRASAGRETNTSIARGLGDAGAALDASARAQYKRRLEDLRHQLELAEEVNDIGRAARAREEIEFIEDQVSAAVGLGGRDRKNASPAERARVAVTKAIKTAVGRIRIADPELGRHLALSIQTGYFCVYRPRQQVDWEL